MPPTALRRRLAPVGRGSFAPQSCPSTLAAAWDRLRLSEPTSRASRNRFLSEGPGVWRGRNRNGESAAAAGLAFDRHASVMRFGDELNDTQSQPATAAFA